MVNAPERIWVATYFGHTAKGFWQDEPIRPNRPENQGTEYVRADLTPPVAVIEAMERALRHADQVSRDLGWHRIYDETGRALAALTAWRAGK